MKTKFIFLAALSLGLAGSCKKLEPPVTPMEPAVKYLSKVIGHGSDSELHIWESCTWDSLGRLLTFNTQIRDFPYENIFHYNPNGQISRINFRHWLYGSGYYELFWKNEKELDSIELYHDELVLYKACHKYEYNDRGKCIKIHRKDYLHPHNETYHIEWIGNNISKLYALHGADTSYFIDNPEYDDKHSIYSALPKFPLLHFAGIAYNPSDNNALSFFSDGNSYSKVYYEYNEDGYPIKGFILVEGVEKNIYSIEYK